MRILVDINRDSEGRVSGHIERRDGAAVPFSGWLELLRLLEDRAPLAGIAGGAPRAATAASTG